VAEYGEHTNVLGIGRPKIGGNQYDITQMSSEVRAKNNFDSVDPLPKDIPEECFLEIRRG
jgi:hypothetical protein